MSIVGFAPRWIGLNSDGDLKYLETSEDPPWQTPDATPKEGYSIMLTKVMMVHRDLLHQYTCGTNKLRHKVHRMVDLYRNCEDVGFNALTALSRKKVIGTGPSLFVKPLHQLGDFGKSGTALHARSKHQQVRSNCLNLFQKEFHSVARNTKDSAFPIQDTVIETQVNPAKKSVELRKMPYAGHKTRLHVDCIIDEHTGELKGVGRDGDVTPLPEACKWSAPEPGLLESYSFSWAS